MGAQQQPGTARYDPRDVAGVLGLVGLVLVGVITWFVVHDPRPQAPAGSRYVVSSDDLSAVHSRYLDLPWGRVDVGVTDPRHDLPHDLVRYDLHRDPEPPDGGRFVGLSWKADTPVGQQPGVALAPFPRTHLSLVADGHTYPVEDPQAAAAPCAQVACVDDGSAWIAVAGSAKHLTFAAEYAGVTQTVDLRTGARHPGLAAGLYPPQQSTGQRHDCGSATLPPGWTSSDDSPYCTLTVSRTPYLPRFGWAAKGTTWLAVGLLLEPPLFVRHQRPGPDDSFTTSDDVAGVTVSVSGAQRRGLVLDPATDLTAIGPGGRVVAFSAPAAARPATVTVTGTVPLVPRPADEGGGPARGPLELAMTWTVAS